MISSINSSSSLYAMGHSSPQKSSSVSETEENKPTKPGEEQQEKTSAKNQQSLRDKQTVQKMEARDSEVRAHEAAHLAASGGLAMGGASFSYQRGPDGKLYANGGEVSIDTSKVPNDPQATLQKSQQIQRAALAPANPSSQDRSVAAAAARMAMEARQEIQKEQLNPESDNKISGNKGTNAYRQNAQEQDSPPKLDAFA